MTSSLSSERFANRRESLEKVNKVVLGPGVRLEGKELEDFCRKRGLCPLCARTRTRRRVFKLFKKNRWEPLTVSDTKSGTYSVYKGYCIGPNCFTIEQAKRMAGEVPKRQISSKTRSEMKGVAEPLEDDVDEHGGYTHKRNPKAFPPTELKNVSNFEVQADKPRFVMEKTAEALRSEECAMGILDLSNVEFRVVDMTALVEALKVNRTLTSLILENCKLSDETISVLAEGLDEAKDLPLARLYLRANQIGDVGMDALSTFLESNTALEKLDLSRNCISSNGGVVVFNSFHRNQSTRIRCINLSHNEIWDLEEDQFGARSFLSRNRTLRILNLEANYIHDEGVQALASGIQTNDQTALERLYLGWNAVGDEGTIALADMLEMNTSLRVLGLGENEIQNAGARALLTSMDVNTTLREISGLWRNKIDRRFLIVAIRRLLLSADRGGHTEVLEPQPGEQAPRNGTLYSSELISNVSSFSRDLDYDKPGNADLASDAFVDMEKDLNHQQTKRVAVCGPPSEQPLAKPVVENGAVPQEATGTLKEADNHVFGRLSVFQSAPLVCFDRESGVQRRIPLLDFMNEKLVIEKSLSGVDGAEIDVVGETATLENFSEFFTDESSNVIHFSSLGDPHHLSLENGFGSLQTLQADGLRRLVAASKSGLRLAFVSSCHALSIGQAFVSAGVPHVVCCQLEASFRDFVAEEFILHFYRALANNKVLTHAFDLAVKAVKSSNVSKNQRQVTDRFHLLPERISSERYHDVPVFFTSPVPPKPESHSPMQLAHIPAIPQNFLGREVDMFEILEALRVDDIVKITGSPGNGKDSVVSAVCNYALLRKEMFSIDDIFWLPTPNGVAPEDDSLYGDLSHCANTLQSASRDIWDTDETLLECRERIAIELEELRVVLVVDDRSFIYKGAQDGLEKFLSYLLNIANAKVLLITSRNGDTCSSISMSSAGSRIEEASIEISPLDFRSTAQLFGSISKFISSVGCPAAHSATEFAELLEPSFISKMPDPSIVISQRRSDLYAKMGGGLPLAVVAAAKNMTKDEFIELIAIANRPEVFVDSLGSLEKEIGHRALQRQLAVEGKNFLRAVDLDVILEELEEMRPEFPTLTELREEEEVMKGDLANAVTNRRYDQANEVKRQLLILKKKIMKELRLVPNSTKEANKKINELQAQVRSIMGGGNANDDMTKATKQRNTATFAVHCDNRDCSFAIYPGDVHEFNHVSEAMGVVCWTNESCELDVRSSCNARLIEIGGPAFEAEIASIPVAQESPYGPIRCGTGNALILGPARYGGLEAPCVILAVGPLSPNNVSDVNLDDDTDSFHYISSMLRSCYRSSMVLARHAELQALALPLLTTRKMGQAYEETLKTGLQTLLEEVKFSHLRDLHIMASSPQEASILISLMSSMGHQQI